MRRTITLSRRYSVILASLNAWTLAGGGLLITLGGNPILGPLLLAAGLVVLALAADGRIRRQRSAPVGQLLISLLGVPIMFFGLLLLGGGLIPARFDLIWYGFLFVLVILAIVAIAELAGWARSGDTAP